MPALQGRLGPLVERDFRLLFAATTITTLGDRLAFVALAFAVLALPGASATDIGLVIAARQITQTLVLLWGGVLSDRLPRNLVLVGASLVQAAAQAVTATLLLTDLATVPLLMGLAAVYGVGGGLVVPAEVGLVPQTVSAGRLQQANALQGLSRNITGVIGPALGGLLVVLGSPGAALAFDAASFLLCAVLLARIAVPRRAPVGDEPGFLHELREGWREFASRTWLWASVVLCAISNMVEMSWPVLGPALSESHYGGAGTWAFVLSAGGVGAIAGGLVALRIRPSRPFLVSLACTAPIALQLAALAAQVPAPLLAAANFVSAAGLSIHLTLWFTVFQREVPEHAQSRVSSYDALGSFVLLPVGAALAGPAAVAFGVSETLWAAAAITFACTVILVSLPSVRAIRAPEAAPAVAASSA